MNVVIRRSFMLKALTQRNNYAKSFSFGSKYLNAEEIFNHSINRTFQQYTSLNEEHSISHHAHPLKQYPRQLELEKSSLISIRLTPEEQIDQKPKKKSKKTKKAKELVEGEGMTTEVNLQKQNQLMEQYPALNYLNQTLGSTKVKSSEEKDQLTNQERYQNSVQFMRIISNSMSPENSSKIIQIIENHCSTLKNKKKQERKSLEQIRAYQRDKAIFKNIKRKLEKELASEEHQNIDSTFVKKIVQSLKNVNPFQITMDEFQKNYNNETQVDPKMLIKVKMAPEDLLLKQKQLVHDQAKEIESSKYAYIYELPYNLKNEEAQDLVVHLQKSKKLKIHSFMIFPFKNRFDYEHKQIVFRVPDDYQEGNSIEKTYTSLNIQPFTKGKKGKNQSPIKGNQLAIASHSRSEKMLTKMKQQTFLKYNKSSMIIKFQSQEHLKKIVTPSTRLFGLTYRELQNIKLEEASQKTTLVVSGVPVGCTGQQFVKFVNNHLKPIGIQIEESPDIYFSTQSVQLKFHYFVDTLQALLILNNLQFEGRRIKTQIKYGSIRMHKGQYVHDESGQNVEIVKKIMQIRQDFHNKFEQLDLEYKL